MPEPGAGTVTPTANWEGYAVTFAGLHGGLDPRSATLPVRGWLRLSYLLGRAGGRLGVRPLAVTLAGLGASLAAPLVAARHPGGALVAALLVLLAAAADSVDGALALVTGQATRLGYVHDALADRVAELCWAAAFFVLGVPWPVCAAAVAVGWLYEYVCAQAAVAAMSARGPVAAADRPVRVALAAGGLALSGVAGMLLPELAVGTATLVMAIWVLLGLGGLAQLLTALRSGARR